MSERPRHIASAAFVAVILILAMAFPVLPVVDQAHAEEFDQEASRAIAIAYDNSGSMTKDSDKWCNAQYSLEVLAAMMGDRDELALFAMDAAGEKLHVSSAQDAAARAASVHNADLGVSLYTEPRTAREACDWLFGQQSDEKYLVITTDGEFNTGNRLEDVRQTVEDAAAHGIEVIYLAIGDADLIAADESRKIYVKQASGDNILQTMTETANLIFGRTPLNPALYDAASGKVDLEVPMGRLVVFAQGPDVNIGALTTSDGTAITPRSAQVRYRDRPTNSDAAREWTDSARVNTNLQGVVASFDEHLPKGEAHLDIAGAQNYEIYYQPDIDIAIDLQDDTGFVYTLEPGASTRLTAGTYTVDYRFLDPDTSEVLTSDLLYPAAFSLEVDNAGNYANVAQHDPITLERGQAVIRATATTPGGGKARQQYSDVRVVPPAVPLEIAFTSRPDAAGPIDVHALDDAAPYAIHVTKQGGEELSAEEWADTTLEAEIEPALGLCGRQKLLGAQLEKTATPGTFQLKLATNDGKVVETRTGEVPVSLQALCDQADVQYRGAAQEIVHISDPSLFDLILYLLWLIVLVAVIVALLLWLFGAGRISRKIWCGITLEGYRIPISGIGSKPRRIGAGILGLFTNKWEWEGTCKAKIPVPPQGRIVLHGKYFKFGKEVKLVNYKDWKALGWKLVDRSGNPTKPSKIRKRTRLVGSGKSKGYTIWFGK